jgi:hypothetical protein
MFGPLPTAGEQISCQSSGSSLVKVARTTELFSVFVKLSYITHP